MKTTRLSLLLLAVLRVSVLAQTALPNPPDTPRRPVIDQYHGIQITDDYRWLENWDDPAVRQWSARENQRTRQYLDHLRSRPAIQEQLKKLAAASSASHSDLQFRAGMLFAERR